MDACVYINIHVHVYTNIHIETFVEFFDNVKFTVKRLTIYFRRLTFDVFRSISLFTLILRTT